jgi:hypothetical protein
MSGRVIHLLLVMAAMAGALPAAAQNLVQGRWSFTQGRVVTTGDVTICKTNAPAGNFWAGRQPVLKAHADVDKHWRVLSQCVAPVNGKVDFTVGPAPTWVEYECVLTCDRDLQGAGLLSTVGYGMIDGKAAINCTPVNSIRAAVGKDTPLTRTDKVKRCLAPNVKHTAEAHLSVSAIINPGLFGGNPHGINNCATTARRPVGLPNGLMLILQPKGTCTLPGRRGFFKGDVDGDGEFALADISLLERLMQDAEKPFLGEDALAAADVAEPCTGKPDSADFEAIKAAYMSGLESPGPARKSACGGEIGVPPG